MEDVLGVFCPFSSDDQGIKTGEFQGPAVACSSTHTLILVHEGVVHRKSESHLLPVGLSLDVTHTY